MNVERTIEFILKAQAKAEVRAEKTDRRVDNLAKVVQQGMKMLVRLETKVDSLADTQTELAEAQKEFAAAQKETDRLLKAFIKSMNRNGQGGNGRQTH